MPDILVLAKLTVDTAVLKTDPISGEPRVTEAPLRISTFDEHALEAALQLTELHGGAVTVLSLLPSEPPKELLLRVLAKGAAGIHLVVDPTAWEEPLGTATLLAAAACELRPWDLVLCGDGSLDYYHRQVGPRVAEELGIPSLTEATEVELEDGKLLVHRALEECSEVVEAPLPALVAVGSEINEPRLPTVMQIMRAGAKPVTMLDPGSLGLPNPGALAAPMLETLRIAAPPSTRKGIVVEGEGPQEIASQLARLLLAEGAIDR